MNKKLLALVVGMTLSTAATAAETPNLEQLWNMVQQQQAEIAALKDQLGESNARLQETEIVAEATVTAIEQFALAPLASQEDHLSVATVNFITTIWKQMTHLALKTLLISTAS